ncbi:Por secretion system C-terminal sorting domain-containing protein [Flaviramulus basaltis]|uniref:Por secretion system C-terminal sorting domain-containing protein n=2 Tax=Flaviramulus basaltis TaxID=369401 RepID=A0A1K2IKK9_9FLAO|nr:Por secretion system C-terminal sorting domain-containing protein [Flaviramulus basaltis]
MFFVGLLLTLTVNSQNTVEMNCQDLFLSGVNLAWDQFGGDVGFDSNPNLAFFDTFFSDVKAAGGNSVRWWFHTDGSFTPEIQSSGYVTGLHETLTNDQIIAQVVSILDTAEANDIYLNISLFSFDMLQDYSGKAWTGNDFTGNKPFFESESNIQSYIDNALTPLVNAVKDHNALGSWEIFNEPEGMTSQFGWTGNQGGEFISITDVQLTVNMLADAIHNVDPDALVTNGAWAMIANTDNGSYTNYYSDANLLAIGNNNYPNGTLDYYQVHYYDWQSTAISPFAHPASFWNLDKPLVIGEFHANEANTALGVTDDSPYDWLYDNGYAGAWGWQYNTTELWSDIEPQIAYMQIQNPTAVNIDPNACLSAEFSSNVTSTCEDNAVTFTAASSSSNITSWIWDFGDGQTANTKGPHAITYTTAGTYSVSLTTSNGVDNDTVIKTDLITITAPSTVAVTIADGSSCATSVTFNAELTPTIASGASLRWYLNNAFQSSASGQLSFTPASIADGDQIRFEVSHSSLSVCHTSSTLVSETITLDCNALSADEFNLNSIELYPNPVTNIINIRGLHETANIEVYSSYGNKVLSLKSIESNKIDISNLASGMYVVRISTDKGQAVKKVIKL